VGKAYLIAKALGRPSELYFNEKDEEYLRQLDDELASAVWRSIKAAVSWGERGLYEGTCPFCLITKHKCNICPYAEQHGVCSHPDSHFKKIRERGLDYLYGASENVLTNEFYRELVERIESLRINALLDNLTQQVGSLPPTSPKEVSK